MGTISDLVERYKEMDYVDRQNFWTTVILVTVGVIAVFYALNTLGILGGYVEETAEYVNSSMGLDGLSNITGP